MCVYMIKDVLVTLWPYPLQPVTAGLNIHQVIQEVLHNLGGVNCQPFLKSSAHYAADLMYSLAFQFTNFEKPYN